MKTHLAGPLSSTRRRLTALGTAALFGLLLAQTAPAVAHDFQVRTADMQGAVPTLALGTLESQTGETKVDFLKRVGRLMDTYTTNTSYETCGIITNRPQLPEGSYGKWAVPLVTQESHIACGPVVTVPLGAVYTGETIHSHPSFEAGVYRATHADRVFTQALHKKTIRKGARLNLPSDSQRSTFSDTDYAAGAGWLVVNGELYSQNGRGTAQNQGLVKDARFLMAQAPEPLPNPVLPGVRKGQINFVNQGVMLSPIKIMASETIPRIASMPNP